MYQLLKQIVKTGIKTEAPPAADDTLRVTTERLRGELRTEFFNLFNWANFNNPGNNVLVPSTFGRVTSTSSGPRVIQFAFKLNF